MLNDIISQSVILLPFIFLILMNVPQLRDNIYLFGLFGYALTLILSDYLKNYIFYKNGRPKGAFNCDIFNKDGIQEGKPGYPSGHMSSTSFFVSFFIFIILFKTKLDIKYKIILISLLIFYLFMIANSRYQKKCHSIKQIIGGSIFGFVMFILILGIYQLIKKR